MKPGREPKKFVECPRCKAAGEECCDALTFSWHTAVNGMKMIRVKCDDCGYELGWASQTPDNKARADMAKPFEKGKDDVKQKFIF